MKARRNGSKSLLQNPMLSSMKASYFEKSPYLAWIISSISGRPMSPYGCWVQFIVWIPNPSSPLSLRVSDICHEKKFSMKRKLWHIINVPCCMNSSLCCTGAIVKIRTIWTFIFYRQAFRKPIITFYWTKCNKKRLQIIQSLFGFIFSSTVCNYFADAQVRFEIPRPFPCASDCTTNTNKSKTLTNFGTVFNSSIVHVRPIER